MHWVNVVQLLNHFFSNYVFFVISPLNSFLKKMITETYLEPSQTTVMGHFCENGLWFFAANYFRRKSLSTPLGGHSFSTYAKFSEKLIFLIPSYAHVGVRIRG